MKEKIKASFISFPKHVSEMVRKSSDGKISLDIESNKNNRVLAAQFASIEAIANTPRSPRFNNSISNPNEKVNPSDKKHPFSDLCIKR